MQYPIMRGAGKYRVVAAQLSGGLNLSDPPGQVEDNQLTACRNMWWHQGALRTRPGLGWHTNGIIRNVFKTIRVSEQECIFLSRIEKQNETVCAAYSFHSGGTIYPLGSFVFLSPWPTVTATTCDDEEYGYRFYVGDGRMYKAKRSLPLTEIVENVMYQDQTIPPAMVAVEPYVPTVTVEKFDADIGEYKHVAFETYNVLTDAYKRTLTSDGERIEYLLPEFEDDDSYFDLNVNIRLRDTVENTVKVFSVQCKGISSGYVYAGHYGPISGSYAGLSNDTYLLVKTTLHQNKIEIGFGEWYEDYSARDVQIDTPLPEVNSNNIELEFSNIRVGDGAAYDNKAIDAMCSYVDPIWFSGSNSGLSDGTRLFMTNGAAVYWSEINDPLYFPENNYAYVGRADERVTALAKQGDQLIVFKENEIYAMQYVAGNSVTLEDIENGVDISAAAATFPIVPIHPTIGCDCPNSVRLVNNRLVWATSDAHIYMMPSLNLYSERNVRDITALIRRELEPYKGSDLKEAMAAEYKGHYMLTTPSGKIFLLDTGNSAFQSYTYYASERRASRMLPWYVWDVPVKGIAAVVSSAEKLSMLGYRFDTIEHNSQVVMGFAGQWDVGRLDAIQPIPCSFSTKVYDFGQVDKLKRVGQMVLSVGSQAGDCVRLTYITERETVEDAYRIEPTETVDLYAPDYLKLYRVLPNINRTRMFGLRCDSDGTMAVEGIHLTYSLQGDVR